METNHTAFVRGCTCRFCSEYRNARRERFANMSIADRAKMYGCSVEQICAQYRANAADLDAMAEKAERTGKKVNKYTAAELRHLAESMRHEADRA